MLETLENTGLSIRLGALQGLLPLIESIGEDASKVLAPLGLSVDDFAMPDKFIPYTSHEAILENSAALYNVPDFGLRLANAQGLAMLGPVGLMIMHSESVLEAAFRARNYMSLHVLAEYWTFDVSDELCVITRFQHQRQQRHQGQPSELSLGVCYRILRRLVGPDFKLSGLHFTHRRISSDNHYTQYFDAPVNFSQERDQLFFPKRFLTREIATFDESITQQLEVNMDRRLRTQGDKIDRETQALILASLGMSQSMLTYIAGLLHMHPRTLQRRLKANGYSFKRLVLETRMNVSRWVLSNSEMPLTQLSLMLGYNELSAFSKAFKTYHALSPRAWRQRNLNE